MFGPRVCKVAKISYLNAGKYYDVLGKSLNETLHLTTVSSGKHRAYAVGANLPDVSRHNICLLDGAIAGVELDCQNSTVSIWRKPSMTYP